MSLDDVKQVILQPYISGQTILINGKRLDQREIGRLQITETDHGSEYLLPAASQEVELEGYSSTHPTIKYFPSSFQDLYRETYVSLRMMNRGRDVTNDLIRAMTSSTSTESQVRSSQSRPELNTNIVFVVHGRNEHARRAMFDFLRAIGLQPLEWLQAVKATGKTAPYIGEILDAAFSMAHAVVVLLTPDDEARLQQQFRKSNDESYEINLSGQARPNVLFEAGMAMGRDPNCTVLVELGRIRPFSDVAGRHVIHLNNTPEQRQELAQRLQSAGCPVNLEGTDWHTVGDFDAVLSLQSTQGNWHSRDQSTSQVKADPELVPGSKSRVPTEIDAEQSQVTYRDTYIQVAVFVKTENHLDIPARFKGLTLDIETAEGESQGCRFIAFQPQPFEGQMLPLRDVILPPRQEVQGWVHF